MDFLLAGLLFWLMRLPQCHHSVILDMLDATSLQCYATLGTRSILPLRCTCIYREDLEVTLRQHLEGGKMDSWMLNRTNCSLYRQHNNEPLCSFSGFNGLSLPSENGNLHGCTAQTKHEQWHCQSSHVNVSNFNTITCSWLSCDD